MCKRKNFLEESLSFLAGRTGHTLDWCPQRYGHSGRKIACSVREVNSYFVSIRISEVFG